MAILKYLLLYNVVTYLIPVWERWAPRVADAYSFRGDHYIQASVSSGQNQKIKNKVHVFFPCIFRKMKFSFDSSGHKFGRLKDFGLINIFLTQIINKIVFARES